MRLVEPLLALRPSIDRATLALTLLAVVGCAGGGDREAEERQPTATTPAEPSPTDTTDPSTTEGGTTTDGGAAQADDSDLSERRAACVD